jgi:aryl-alcohol dehydrogenase-like predicted oxidoreductase
MYNLLARGIEQEFLPMCKRMQTFTCIYNPLAGGFLTGKQQIAAPAPGSRFDGNQMYLDRYWHPSYFSAVETLSQAARGHGRSLVSLALCWLYYHTPADCLILGASRLEQLEGNLAALDEGPLPEELVKVCDEVWASLRGVTPKYNR